MGLFNSFAKFVTKMARKFVDKPVLATKAHEMKDEMVELRRNIIKSGGMFSSARPISHGFFDRYTGRSRSFKKNQRKGL